MPDIRLQIEVPEPSTFRVMFVSARLPCCRFTSGAGTIRVEITEAAITGDDIWYAFLNSAILAIPIHLAHADIDDCAPRSVTESVPDWNVESHRRSKHRARDEQFVGCFHGSIVDWPPYEHNAQGCVRYCPHPAIVPVDGSAAKPKLTRLGRFASRRGDLSNHR
jgi:hypothetical protein